MTEAPPRVDFLGLDTLWVQVTGTVCNIACRHCFIACGPKVHTHDLLTARSWRGANLEDVLSQAVDTFAGRDRKSRVVLTGPDLALRASSPDSTVEAELGDLVLAGNGDGSVTVTMADEIEMVVGPGPETTEADRATLVLRPGDLSILVSGDPSEMVFESDAPRYEIELTEVISEGTPTSSSTRRRPRARRAACSSPARSRISRSTPLSRCPPIST